MSAKRYLILPLAGAALAAAGCGSSSSHSATPAAQASTPSTTTTMGHEKSMPTGHGSKSMPMGHPKGQTAASMAGMPTTNAEVTVASSPHYGNVLYDKDHFVLYEFSADHGSTSTCYGACSSGNGGWPPLLTKGAPHVAGLKASLLGTTKRTDGTFQVTYAGHPLYYWSGDTSKTIECQHVKLHGGFWYVVNPDGTPNTAKGIGTMGSM